MGRVMKCLVLCTFSLQGWLTLDCSGDEMTLQIIWVVAADVWRTGSGISHAESCGRQWLPQDCDIRRLYHCVPLIKGPIGSGGWSEPNGFPKSLIALVCGQSMQSTVVCSHRRLFQGWVSKRDFFEISFADNSHA